jgi:hypothetical protein
MILAKEDKQDEQDEKGGCLKEGNGRKALIFEHGAPPPKWTCDGPEHRSRKKQKQRPQGTGLQDFCDASMLFSE